MSFRYYFISGFRYLPTSQGQFEPQRSFHDPNPPIPLDSLHIIDDDCLTFGSSGLLFPTGTYLPPVPQAVFQARGDEEAGTSLANFYSEQQDDWNRQVEAVPWNALPFLDDEIARLVSFPGDQEEDWNKQVQVTVWCSSPKLDDEIGSSLADFFSDQEDDWNKQRETIAWLPAPFLDDEIGSTLANFYREQEDDWNKQVQVTPWTVMPFLDEDPIETWLAMAEEWSITTVWSDPWNVPDPFVEDEPLLFPVTLEQEDAASLLQQAAAWLALTFSLDEDFTTLVPAPEQEDAPILVQQKVPWLSLVFVDDELFFRLFPSTRWFADAGIIVTAGAQAGKVQKVGG